MENLQAKNFSIIENKGSNTVIYQVNKTKKEYLKDYPKYTVERLECIEEILGDKYKRTFFVENPQKNGNPLVFFSFKEDEIIVNSGKLINNEVRITKSPKSYKFETIQTSEDDLERDVPYTPNLKRPITIIDIETGKEVTPRLYYDDKTDQVRGKCTMKPNKSYFAFEIRDKQ